MPLFENASFFKIKTSPFSLRKMFYAVFSGHWTSPFQNALKASLYFENNLPLYIYNVLSIPKGYIFLQKKFSKTSFCAIAQKTSLRFVYFNNVFLQNASQF